MNMRHNLSPLTAGAALLAGLLLAGLASCGTVASKPSAAHRPSLDAVPDAHTNYANSGLLAFTNHVALITPTARARYNALCVKWGGKFLPPVLPDDGLKPCGANWLMDQDHLDKFATMTLWQGQPAGLGIKPP